MDRYGIQITKALDVASVRSLKVLIMVELSRMRIIFLAINIAAAYVVWGLLISLIPPIYPAEAARKGASSSQYGFVFGIAALAAFLTAPLFGRYGSYIGPKLLYNSGAYLQAVCGICFGFLTYIEGNTRLFIGLSYFLRALGGIADVAAWSSVLSILMKLFPSRAAQIMSWTEMFFGLGYMLGPALGAFLFQLGGFVVPFVSVGSFGLVVATGLVFVLPNVKPDSIKAMGSGSKLTFAKILRSPSIYLPFVDNAFCFFGNGMVTAMMEPHLEQVGATTSQIGITYLIFGGVFAFATPLAGYICDRISYPSIVSVVGNMIMIVTFIFIGPLPFIPMKASLTSLQIVMGVSAFGFGLIMVSTFSRAMLAAVRQGYDKDIETNLLISSLWSSSFYLGNFLGPTIAGIMIDNFGFQNTSVLFWVLYLLIGAVDVGELGYNVKHKITRQNVEYQTI